MKSFEHATLSHPSVQKCHSENALMFMWGGSAQNLLRSKNRCTLFSIYEETLQKIYGFNLIAKLYSFSQASREMNEM